MKINRITQRVAYLIILGSGAKLLIDTTIQLFNPFLIIIAAGVGISAVSMGGVVALRGMIGITAPVIGALADRIGYKKVMIVSLLVTGLGMLMAGFSRNSTVFISAMIITGTGQAGFTPNLHAYLSSRLPYEKRARGIGIVEYSWALAGIVGLFIAGYLIEEISWRAPFILLGILLIFASIVFLTLPGRKTPSVKEETRKKIPLPKQISLFFHLGVNAKSAWGTIAVQGLNMFSIMHIMIIHGGWLYDKYGLSPSFLGIIALIFGVSDLIASVYVSVAVDKIGKKKSVAIGVIGMTAGYLLLPLFNQGLYLAVIGLMIPRIFFEFATVSNLALLSEQVPEERGKVMSLSTTFGLMGITLASALGPLTYYRAGIAGLSLISFSAGVVSTFLILLVVREHAFTAPGGGDSGK